MSSNPLLHFSNLLPERILEAVSVQGYEPTGVLYPLNSYENRVYEIGIEDHEPLIAKFYRPGRWSSETIADEHRFLMAALDLEIPVVAPLALQNHLGSISTLGDSDGIYYALFPKFRGREHPDITDDDRQWLGRTLARLHNLGEVFKAPHRMALNPQTYGEQSIETILNLDFIPDDTRPGLQAYLSQAVLLTEPYFHSSLKIIALHGDCHPGNILWNREGPHLVDFDDMVLAPSVQDVWMLFNGDAHEKAVQQDAFFEGYEMFREFEYDTLILAEPLRTLRMIRHTAWIAQRHTEPIFQWAFPYFRERKYWEEFLQSIKEQIGILQEGFE